MTALEHKELLDKYYRQVKSLILEKQHPVTGLLPASTAVTVHGDYRDAWVRDNVYSILAVWGLALAYRRVGNDQGRSYELEKSTVKLMRALLQAMMRQSGRIERFKSSQALHDAIHAKFNTETGHEVVGDHEWGHLQIDATSLYLLTLVQMISSGLYIIWTIDEVNFIQNLVYYVDRAYRIADYGIWERGEKSNIGYVELNASSIGMAKAALEALAGFDLFGARGSQASVIHVVPDTIAQAEITLRSMLPRESNTKETDAALLSIISYPAFAIDDQDLVESVRSEITSKLQGKYGLKRFLRDGHQTAIEDPNRHYYEPEELRQFENIECEWPLFFCYLLLDGIFREDKDSIKFYRAALDSVLVKQGTYDLLPELYFVPADLVEDERASPGSQLRKPNDNLPLVWAQSLYLLSQFILDGLISKNDIDPIGRHRASVIHDPVVQVVVLAQDSAIATELAAHGVQSQTPEDLSPVNVLLPYEIISAYRQIGRNDKLGLTGRPVRRLKILGSSRVYQLGGETVICLSLFFMLREFYLAYDMSFLIDRFKSELRYLHRHWRSLGRPTVTVLVTRGLLEYDQDKFYAFMQTLRTGVVEGVPVKLGHFHDLLPMASIERMDQLHEFAIDQTPLVQHLAPSSFLQNGKKHEPLSNTQELEIELETDEEKLVSILIKSANLYEQVEVLANLFGSRGPDHVITIGKKEVSIHILLQEVYDRAGSLRLWAVVRHAAALLNKIDIELQNAVSTLLVRQKTIQVGKAYSDESHIIRPIPFDDLLEKINTFCRDDIRDRMMTQEILVYLALMIKSDPDLFKDLQTIRVSYIILLLTGAIAREKALPQEDAFEQLMHLAPSEIQSRLRQALRSYGQQGALVERLESIQVQGDQHQLIWELKIPYQLDKDPEEGWLLWRQSAGTLSRLPDDFYAMIWRLFEHTKGLIVGDKLERRNRLESNLILADMTQGEKAFANRINHLLNKIVAPEYRQLTIEAMAAISQISEQNPDLGIEDYVVFDVLIGHAVRLAYLDQYPELESVYHDRKADAWTYFYGLSPIKTTGYLVRAFEHLLSFDKQLESAS